MTWTKVLKILFWIIAIGIIALIVFVMSIFYILGKDLVSEVETHRHISPSHKVEAVIIEADGGATTSVIQRLYIVKRGDQPSGKPIAVIDGAVIKNKETNSTKYGVIVQWKSPRELVVQYSDARHSGMDHSTVEVNTEKIHIELVEEK